MDDFSSPTVLQVDHFLFFRLFDSGILLILIESLSVCHVNPDDGRVLISPSVCQEFGLHNR